MLRRGDGDFGGDDGDLSWLNPKISPGLFKELTQVTVALDLLVRKTLKEPYLAIFCEPPVPKR